MSASKAKQEDLDRRSADPAGAAEEEGSDAGGQDVAELEAENAALRDRLLRGLAHADNTLRCAERAAHEARQYAVSDFARELLGIADNLHGRSPTQRSAGLTPRTMPR